MTRRFAILSVLTGLTAAASLGGCAAPEEVVAEDMGFVARDFRSSRDFSVGGDAGRVDLANQDLYGADLQVPPDLAPVRDAAGAGDLRVDDLRARDLQQRDASTGDLAAQDMACNPNNCMTPPKPFCRDNKIVTSKLPATCSGMLCTYAESEHTCGFGCWQAACSAKLSFLGDTEAWETNTPNRVALIGGTASSQNTVTIITQTWPPGSAKAVTLVYSLNDPNLANPVELVMSYDKVVKNNLQWFAVVPKQAKGTLVKWYIRADGWDGTKVFYSNFGNNFDYRTQ